MVMANVITSCRIIFSIAMLFFPVFSPGFYGSYLAAGFTDMIDGTIARKLGSESEFGAKLDTVADIILVAVAAYKLMPAMIISRMIWIWIVFFSQWIMRFHRLEKMHCIVGFAFRNSLIRN